MVTYPFQNGVPTKRLSVKFDLPVEFKVRQGIDPHSIEIVLRPASKPTAPPVPAAPTAPGRYAIYLDTHESIDDARGANLPPALARFQVLLSVLFYGHCPHLPLMPLRLMSSNNNAGL